MDSLMEAIKDCFSNNPYNRNYRHHTMIRPRSKETYMIIPISGDLFEIPTFALSSFTGVSIVKAEEKLDAMVVNIKDATSKTTYASMESKVRDVLTLSYTSDKLMKVMDGKDSTNHYYGTHGLLLDKDFNPVMMMSWVIRRTYLEEDNSLSFGFVRPLLRIDPRVFMQKGNAMERYIANRIVPTALLISNVRRPYMNNNCFFEADDVHRNLQVKVEIDKCPFTLQKTDVPSISTTNEELLDVAIQNIDEVVQ